MKSMLSVLTMVAVMVSTSAFVEEYSEAAEEGFETLKNNCRDTPAKVINAGNGLKLKKTPAVISGDTILFESTSIPDLELSSSDKYCQDNEGISINNCLPFCKMTHFGFRVTGTIPEKKRPSKYRGISSESSFTSSASLPLLGEYNTYSDDCDKTYLEIILLFKCVLRQGPPDGLVIHVPVFEVPELLAGNKETLLQWARNEARVGLSSPMTTDQLKELHDSKSVTIKNLQWLQEVLGYRLRPTQITGTGMNIKVSRPLLLSGDVIEGIMNLARKYIKLNKTQNEKPTFSKLFLNEISRRIYNARNSN